MIEKPGISVLGDDLGETQVSVVQLTGISACREHNWGSSKDTNREPANGGALIC